MSDLSIDPPGIRKTEQKIDHDRLFKELLTTFFTDFVALFLPDVAAYLDEGSVVFLDKKLFTDVTAGERHEADLVVKARFRGEEAFFLVHIENQATPQAQFGQRMFRYFARLYEKHALPIYPVALFSYDKPRRPEPDTFVIELPGFVVNQFAFRTIQLNRLNWRDFLRQPNPVASALMAKMRIAPADRPRVKMECLRLLGTLHLDPAKMQLISSFVDTYLSLTAEEERSYRKLLETIPPQEKEQMMQIVTSWMREGMEIGREEGREEGQQTGQANTLLRQLHRRFGTISDEVETRVRSLPHERLDLLSDSIFDFTTLSEAEIWLADQN